MIIVKYLLTKMPPLVYYVPKGGILIMRGMYGKI